MGFLAASSVGTSVETAEIADGAVTTDKLAANAVTAAKASSEIVTTASPVALTQTYATADATHAALTAAALTNSLEATTVDGTLEAITGVGTVSVNAVARNFSELADQNNKLRADLTDLKQFVNTIADQLQAKGLAS